MNFRFFAWLSALGFSILLAPISAEAGCGLDHCPIQSSTINEHPSEIAFETPLKIHSGEFNLATGQGSFIETALGLIVTLTPELVFGAEASWVKLFVNGDVKTGSGNPVAFIQYTVLTTNELVLSLGSQLEFPMKSSPTAIASSHYEVLPYASARYDRAEFYSSLRAGGRFALEGHGDGHSHGDHSHDNHLPDGLNVDNTQYVNGHHDSELLLWWNIGRKWSDHLDTYAFINSQTSLSEDTSGQTYTTAGLSGITKLIQLLEIHVAAEVPVTENRWFDWRTMVKAGLHF